MRSNRQRALAVLVGIGVGLAGVILFDVYEDWLVQGNALGSTLAENALPLLLLGMLFYAAWDLWAGEYDGEFVATVTKWTAVGVATMAVLTGWVVGSQLLQNELKPAIVVLQIAVAGAVAGVLVGRNTASLERTRDEVRHEKERFESLFENTPSAVADLQFDEDRLIVRAANPAFRDAFDARTGDAVAETLPDPDESTIDRLRSHVADGEPLTVETTYDTEAGDRHFVVELVPYGVEGEADRTRAYVVYQDVTDIRSTEAELERTVDRLERSNEQLQQFAYVASHDLQEPLRMVSSYVDLLESEYGDELDDEADEYIQFAVDGARRMQAMIDGLLQYSRVHTQGEAFERVDADAVLDRVLKDLELLLTEIDATVTSDDLPAVVADENQLGQLLQNLVSNAVEHGSEADDVEGPHVHVSGEERADSVVLSVADDGPGIPEGQQERVFELFEQSSRDDDGTGLGLAICKRIVDRHDGDIWVDSADGEGATFHVELPRAPEQSTGRGRNG
jgi:signal transduction histidine kinase